MKCPFCGHQNISGEDECEVCFENLSSLDGVVPKGPVEQVLMEDPISRLAPSREPVIGNPEMSVQEAVKKMNAAGVGCLLVKKDGKLVGILTERDILFKLIGQVHDLSTVAVEAVMTRNPQTLSEDDTLAFAVNRMSVYGFRHVPIVRGGQPISVISVRNVLGYLSKLFP